MQDIFGGIRRVDDKENCLYACESTEEYDQKVTDLKVKWNEMEREHTRNNPPNKFSSYFETYKEKQVREKMIKAVRRKANIDGEYGQNPIEWLNFLSKEEIDEFGKPEGHTHRDVMLTTALAALKNRYLRLYANFVKAIYDEGPYMLSTSYSHLIVSYDEWCDMPATEKSELVKALMTYVPPASLQRSVTASFSRTTTTEMEPADGDLQDLHASNTVPKQIPTPSIPRRLIITAQEANLPVEAVPLASLQDIFKRAEFLLNEPGAIMKAASNEERMRTVKSRYGEDPLIVKPQKKNKNLFECNCKMFKGLGVCADTIAVAEDNGVLIEYAGALGKKFHQSKRVPNLTAAMDSNLSISNRGHKPNEVQKARKNAAKTRQESVSASLHTRKEQSAAMSNLHCATTQEYSYSTTTSSNFCSATMQDQQFPPSLASPSYNHPVHHSDMAPTVTPGSYNNVHTITNDNHSPSSSHGSAIWMNAMQNMNSCHIDHGYHAQSSLPIWSSYGIPHAMPWQNVIQEPNRNNPTNDQT